MFGNVPLQKWVNLIISLYGRTLDVYIDGKLVRTCVLPGVAQVNPDADILVTPMGGFQWMDIKLPVLGGGNESAAGI